MGDISAENTERHGRPSGGASAAKQGHSASALARAGRWGMRARPVSQPRTFLLARSATPATTQPARQAGWCHPPPPLRDTSTSRILGQAPAGAVDRAKTPDCQPAAPLSGRAPPICPTTQRAPLSTNGGRVGDYHRKFEGRKADTAVVMPPQAHREVQVKQNKTKHARTSEVSMAARLKHKSAGKSHRHARSGTAGS